MTPTEDARTINRFYARHDLEDAIFRGLHEAGVDTASMTIEDLSHVDQYHSGGAAATNALLSMADLPRHGHVLDVGGGMGGAARFLTQKLDCRVTVLDLTKEFCRVGDLLSERVGLSDRVDFTVGSALDMPFPDSHFDSAWMQNTSMNISDKQRLFGEICRVLKPGSRLAMQENVSGNGQPPVFPVTWAHDASTSFLSTVDEMRSLVEEAGFRVLIWRDATETLHQAMLRMRSGNLPAGVPLVAQVLFGPKLARVIMSNAQRNVAEGRTGTLMAILERPA